MFENGWADHPTNKTVRWLESFGYACFLEGPRGLFLYNRCWSHPLETWNRWSNTVCVRIVRLRERGEGAARHPMSLRRLLCQLAVVCLLVCRNRQYTMSCSKGSCFPRSFWRRSIRIPRCEIRTISCLQIDSVLHCIRLGNVLLLDIMLYVCGIMYICMALCRPKLLRNSHVCIHGCKAFQRELESG